MKPTIIKDFIGVFLLLCTLVISNCQRSSTVETDDGDTADSAQQTEDSGGEGTENIEGTDSSTETASDSEMVVDTMRNTSTDDVELMSNSWLLTSMKLDGEGFELNPFFSYEFDGDPPGLELNFLVLSPMERGGVNFTGQGMFYRWTISVSGWMEATNQVALLQVESMEYPPFHLIEPLADDFCPDACRTGKVVYEAVLSLVTRFEIIETQLVFSSEDRTSEAVFQLSPVDLTGVPF